MEKDFSKELTEQVKKIAQITGDINSKILYEYMDTQNNMRKFMTKIIYNKIPESNKRKILNFTSQINNLVKDFLKELNINE